MKLLQNLVIIALLIFTPVALYSSRLLWLWSNRAVQEWSYLKGATTEDTRSAAGLRLDAALKTADLVIKGIGLPVTLAGGFALFLNFWIANKNIQMSQSKLMAESFSQAIQSLGQKEDIHLRLGGIYSLQRIANSSKEDHWAVMEILAAFIRNQSKVTLNSDQPIDSIPLDIQTALTVIGKRYVEWDPSEEVKRIDLTGSFLKEAVLVQGNLEKAILVKSNLSGANLSGTNLSYALISEKGKESDLSGATLNAAVMSGATLEAAILKNAKMARATLDLVNFDSSLLEGVDFSYSNVEKATFYNVYGLTNAQKVSMLNWAKARK